MKKIIMSLGFAAATVLAAQAQETPQEEVQQAPQTQTEQEFANEQLQTRQQNTENTDSVNVEGMQQIETADIPEAIHESIKSSAYKDIEIYQAYTLEGGALNQSVGRSSYQPSGNDLPTKLYQLQGKHNDKEVVLYYTERGRLFSSKEL